MRLDKFLALEGRCTRSGAKEQLRRGRVTVNGAVARDGAQAVDPERDVIALDGETLRYRSEMHLMLNKPAGVLTAANDPRCRTVMDLLPRACAAMGCMPVGRLDLDTEGLLLFTTDGQLAHRLLAPKHGVEKVYIARVDGILTEEDAAAFARGLQLSDFMARPARLEILPPGDTGRVTVCEGKYHHVKRMFGACGRKVTHLKRLTFGGIALDEALAPGEWRELTKAERDALYAAAEGNEND